jgi:hypothetical protein
VLPSHTPSIFMRRRPDLNPHSTCVRLALMALPMSDSDHTVQVWYTENLADFIYPEASLPSLANKTDAAILFTGGGVRSYTATMGYLAGLRDAGLLDKPRYIGGVSGGSWAVATYNYAQLGAPGVATTDEELLCEVVPPENITLDGLKEIAPTCARLSGG